LLTIFKKHRRLPFLFASLFVSQLGTWFTYMLFVVQIFDKTNDERATMLIIGAQAIAGLIGGQIAGIYIENKSPKRTLIISDLISASILAAVVFVPVEVYFYSVFSFFIAFVGSFRVPTFQKYLVGTIDGEDLMQANSSFQMINEIVKIIGPAIAVSVLALLPSPLKSLGFLFDSISYVIAALLLFGISDIKGQQTSHKEENLSWIEKWRGGLTPLKEPITLNIFLVFLLILFGVAGADVVLTSKVSELGLSSYNVGYVVGALGLGLLLTATFAAKYVKKWPLVVQLGVASLLLGICFGLIGYGTNLLSLMIAAFLTGIFNSIFNMSASTFWQQKVPYEQLGRFFGFTNSVFALVTLIGMSANAYISSLFSPSFNIVLCGGLISLAGLILILTISTIQTNKVVKVNKTA
jgi:predicted MFS family arabinose efflux permease